APASRRRHAHRPAVGRRRRRLDGAGLHHLEPRPGTVVRPDFLAPGPRRLAPAVRRRGVPALPAVLLRAGHGCVATGCGRVTIAAGGGSLTVATPTFPA